MSLDGKIVKNYAGALFTLCKEKHIEENIIDEIKRFNAIISSSENLKKALESPIIDKTKKVKFIDSICNKYNFNPLLKHFLHVIVKNKRINILKEIITELERMLREENNKKLVTISAAKELQEDEIVIIKEFLENKLGKKVDIISEVNKSLLGGVVIKYDSNFIDFSIQGALNKIEKLVVRNS